MYTALIVDDDMWALEDAKQCFPLDEFGFRLIGTCMDAEHAARVINVHKPDLVITDICMGQESGLDLMRQCREAGVNALFIILSGYDKFTYAQEAIKYNAFRYMLKPLRDSEARNAIQSAKIELDKQYGGNDVPAKQEDDAFTNILSYIAKSYYEPITLDSLSQDFFINRTYICDLFRKRKNTTFIKYLMECRMDRACELLKREDLSVGAIGRMVGFENSQYFSRVFKTFTGMTPLKYRSQFIGDDAPNE